MSTSRPYTLTIAGFDPCSGAGLSADIKTFEQCGVYGLAVCTALTLQTEDKFFSNEWRGLNNVLIEIEILMNRYPVNAVKFGIVPDLVFLTSCIKLIQSINPKTLIVVDPVWRSSTGYDFMKESILTNIQLLQSITLLTPNLQEAKFICGNTAEVEGLRQMAEHTSILLKGGHNPEHTGLDLLYHHGKIHEIDPTKGNYSTKHGSGCVLSAAITAELAKGKDLIAAVNTGKRYIEKFLSSNTSLLGYHAA